MEAGRGESLSGWRQRAMQPAMGMVVGSGHGAAGVRRGAAGPAGTPLPSTRVRDRGEQISGGHGAAGVRRGAAGQAATPLPSTRLSDRWQQLPAAMGPTLKEDGHEQAPTGTLGTERGAALPGRERVRLDSRQGDVVPAAGPRTGG